MRVRLTALLAIAMLLFPLATTPASAGEDVAEPPVLVESDQAGPSVFIRSQASTEITVAPSEACGPFARRVRVEVFHYDYNTESGEKVRDVLISELDADGHWTDQFTTPADFGARGGFMVVEAQCRFPEGGRSDYSPAFIELIGSITAPATVSPGETVTISGDVCPNAKVTVRVNGEQVQSTPVTSNPDGTWSVEITIPEDAEIGSTIEIDVRCARRSLGVESGPAEQRIGGDSYNYFPVAMTVVAEADETLDDAETADPVVSTPTVTG